MKALDISKSSVVAVFFVILATGAVQAALLVVGMLPSASNSTSSGSSMAHVTTGIDTVPAVKASLLGSSSTGGGYISLIHPSPSGDISSDATQTFQIGSGSGVFAANPFEGGAVSNGYGNNASSPSFNGDATRNMIPDQYQINTGDMRELNFSQPGNSGGEHKVDFPGGIPALGGDRGNGGKDTDVVTSPVPEANSVGMLVAGLALLAVVAHRRKSAGLTHPGAIEPNQAGYKQ